jgi:predicted nucleic acid-binding protein
VIFLDANIFIRFIGQDNSAESAPMVEAARKLFAAVETGSVTVTTNEVVLHEVAYNLNSNLNYGLDAARIASYLSTLLRSPGFRMPSVARQRCLRALDLWSEHPSLGFADSLIVATLESTSDQLATFDRHFNRFADLKRWDPSELDD